MSKKTTTTKRAKQATATGKPAKAARKAKRSAKKPVRTKRNGKLSALDAAAKVLAETGEPMGCRQMIEAMAAKRYWTSPAGKTPHATLYAAILRETKQKAKDSRFRKADRGRFTLASPKA